MLFPKRLDLDVHTRRLVELHECIHRLLRGLENVEQTLVGADLELLARLLVHVRGAQDAIFVLHRGQWNWARDLCAGAPRRLDNLTRGLIQDAIVVCLQPDANSFFSNHVGFLTPSGYPERKELAAWCEPLLAFRWS